MELKLSKSRLRPWKPGDEESLVRHANSRVIWRNLRDAFPHPYTLANAEHWIRSANPATPVTNFAIVVDGTAVGGIGLVLKDDVFRRSAEIGSMGRRTGQERETGNAGEQNRFHRYPLFRRAEFVPALQGKSAQSMNRIRPADDFDCVLRGCHGSSSEDPAIAVAALNCEGKLPATGRFDTLPKSPLAPMRADTPL